MHQNVSLSLCLLLIDQFSWQSVIYSARPRLYTAYFSYAVLPSGAHSIGICFGANLLYSQSLWQIKSRLSG